MFFFYREKICSVNTENKAGCLWMRFSVVLSLLSARSIFLHQVLSAVTGVDPQTLPSDIVRRTTGEGEPVTSTCFQVQKCRFECANLLKHLRVTRLGSAGLRCKMFSCEQFFREAGATPDVRAFECHLGSKFRGLNQSTFEDCLKILSC